MRARSRRRDGCERSFGTAQDRLVKEMRGEGVDSLAETNRFLDEYWMPLWNERFVVAPKDPRDAHRPLPSETDLDALFAETETRTVANDFTVRFENRYWQVPEREAAGVHAGSKVVVERRLDGDLRFRVGGAVPGSGAAGPARRRREVERSRAQARAAESPARSILGGSTSAPARSRRLRAIPSPRSGRSRVRRSLAPEQE